MDWNSKIIDSIIERAISEDLGTGDITTDTLIPPDQISKGHIMVKEDGVIAGLKIAELIFSRYDCDIEFLPLINDGEPVSAWSKIAELNGPTRGILKGERIALNFLQRLSGIATRTRKFVEKVKNFPVRIADTRKTTPTLRILEKYAVKAGGGSNHRMGLYDAVMIKDNHITAAGSITEAVNRIKEDIPHTVKIEVEVEKMDDVKEALEVGADIIMLDNMDADTMAQAVEMIDGNALVEASGGITEESVLDAAKTGVDVISIGALTHQIKSLDISLDLKPKLHNISLKT